MPIHPFRLRQAVPAAALGLCAATAAHAAVTVHLRASANAAQATVTLGEVADVAGTDRQSVEALRTLPLGRIDAGGKAAVLERADIARWACMKRGLCGAELAWSGARRVEVRGAQPAVVKAGLVDAARQELERALAPLGARLAIEAQDASRGVELPAGAVVFSARPLPDGAMPGSRMSVWVDAHVNGRFVRAVPVQFRVAALVPAWIAKEDVPAGARVDASAFMPGEADLAGMAGAQPRPPAEEFGQAGQALVMRRPLRQGQPLTLANSGPAPLVARGESALLRVKSSPIELESRVEVLQDGFLGQTVRVRTKNAGATLLAKVAGAGLLEAQN